MADLFKEKEMLVHLENCDFHDRMKMSGMFNYFQDMAAIHAYEIGAGYEDMVNKGYYWILLYERIDMIRVPRLYENVIVRTWPKKRERLEFERELEMLDDKGNVIAHGITTWIVIDIKRRMISKAKDVDFLGDYRTETFYDTKPIKRLNLEAKPFIMEYDYVVNYNDLDHNGHMNNAKYLDIINLMHTHEGFEYKKVEVAYVKEAMLNDKIHVGYYIDNNKDCYIGYVNDNVAFEIVVEGEEVK